MPSVVVVVLADVDSIARYSLYPHRVAKGADVPDCYRMWLRYSSGWNTGSLSASRPLVSIAMAAPVRHVAIGLVDFPGGIADTFAVIHSPAVEHTVLGSIAPG